jgi:hypothetical protein
LPAALQTLLEIGDARGNVVADQSHSFDSVDAAIGGFIGVPVLELDPGYGVDVGFATECDYHIDVTD